MEHKRFLFRVLVLALVVPLAGCYAPAGYGVVAPPPVVGVGYGYGGISPGWVGGYGYGGGYRYGGYGWRGGYYHGGYRHGVYARGGYYHGGYRGGYHGVRVRH